MTNRVKNSPTLLAALDGLIALAFALFSVVHWNLDRMAPGGITHFLEIRFTLLNATFGALFVLMWIWTFGSLGLYRSEFPGIFPVLKRTFAASTFMAALLATYLFLARTKGPAAAIATTFFIVVDPNVKTQRWRATELPMQTGHAIRRPLKRSR